MEYFRVPQFCTHTRVMTDPGGIVCLCGKRVDLQQAWLEQGAGADSQCVHCRRCYDCKGKLISAQRPAAQLHAPHAPAKGWASPLARTHQW